ncbi:MAG TPA: permease [Candidatus Ozemobacteraceae bacterium]|nr:permease [Candidatus Ozemobacteraceae bacterium]
MNWKEEWKTLLAMIAVFLGCYFLPIGTPRFDNAVMEALHLVKWYAREHVLLCLVPAFFIAGAITIFISQASVMKYLGPNANKMLAYGVASVSGTILAVCSCTVLPLFNGIYKMGAGLGPACAFLYSGPGINVLAIVMSARILGMDIGIARAIGAISFSVIIGLGMHLLFRAEEEEKALAAAQFPEPENVKPLWHNVVFFGAMIGILVFANWGKPQSVVLTLKDGAVIAGEVQEEIEGFPTITLKVDSASGRPWASGTAQVVPLNEITQRTIPDTPWKTIWSNKWKVTAGFAVALLLILGTLLKMAWWRVGVTGAAVLIGYLAAPTDPLVPFVTMTIALSVMTSTSTDDSKDWFASSWDNAKMILPLLLGGVLVAGFLLGRVGHEGAIPSEWVKSLVGGNSLFANFFASIFGAFMYFATLTEVPIVQGLIGSGMGKGPALALLLAGPALSLPSMLVINQLMGFKKTFAFVCLVVILSTFSGMIFGALVG